MELTKKKLVLLISIMLILGFIGGMSMGFSDGVNWCVKTGFSILNINVTLAEEILSKDIARYKGAIDDCHTDYKN